MQFWERRFWFRVEDTSSGTWLSSFRVLRETEHGVWLETNDFLRESRFVLRAAWKRWACPTVQEAIESYRARKKQQVSILTAQLANAEERLAESGHLTPDSFSSSGMHLRRARPDSFHFLFGGTNG